MYMLVVWCGDGLFSCFSPYDREGRVDDRQGEYHECGHYESGATFFREEENHCHAEVTHKHGTGVAEEDNGWIKVVWQKSERGT